MKAEKKKSRIAICSHAFDSVDYDVYHNHLYCVAKWSRDFDLIFVGKKGLQAAAAREAIIQGAIEKECTHAFFMDADHFFPEKTLYLLMENAEEAMVSGLVCKKGELFPQVVWMIKGEGKNRQYVPWELPLDGNLYEVGVCAFGCTLINLEKIQKLDKPYFRDTCEAPDGKEPTNIRSDVNLCNAFRERIKEKIFVDTRILIGHLGIPQIIYPQNAAIHRNLDETILESRKLREGQQGFWYDARC